MKQAQTTPLGRERQGVARLRLLPPQFGEALLLVLMLLAGGLFLGSVPLTRQRAFSLGSTDYLTAQRFHPAETTDQGLGFRWTDGESALRLPAQGLGSHGLRLRISAPWPGAASVPLTITLNQRPLLRLDQPSSPRRYTFLMPSELLHTGDNEVGLASPTFQPQEVNRNQRALGVVVFEADWWALDQSRWMVPAQLAAIALATGLLYGLLYASGISPGLRLLTAALFLAITLAMRHSDTRFIYRWHALGTTLATAAVLAASLAALWIGRKAPREDSAEAGFGSLASLWSAFVTAHWRALIGYVALTAVMLGPLVLHFSSQIIGPPGDNFEYLWKMQWFSDALLKQHVSPIFAPQIFYPTGAELTISEMAPAHTLLGLPITALWGPVVSYNLMIVLSFVLSGFFTYLLARRLGANPGPAWVAGLIFAFCTRRYYHANGHFGMMGSQWLPLALYGWEGVLRQRRMWDGYVTGMALVLTGWSTLHYGTTFPLLIAAYTLVRLGMRQLPGLLESWRPALLSGALFFALVLPVAYPYVESQQRGETFKHRYVQLTLHSANLLEYVLPNPYHPLWGSWASQFYRLTDGGEHTFGLGYSVLALALAALWLGRRQRIVQALAVISIINVVMSLGPELQLPGGGVLPLPAMAMYEYAPVLGNIRTWSRMAMYVTLCCALLAALALSRLPQRWRRAGWGVAAALVAIESVSWLALSTPQPRPVDLWLRQQPGSGAVAQLPSGGGGVSQLRTIFTGKPTNQGTGKFPPSAYREGVNILARFPDESSLRLLQRWQTDYLIVDDAALGLLKPNWRADLAELPLATEVYRGEGYSVYRVTR